MSSGPRRDLLVIALVAGLLYLPFLGTRDLWNPNEPLYGQAVVEMAARGDWLVPTVNGEVFGEKPVFYYWLALIAGTIGGEVNELTLRLPAALAGIAGGLLIYLLVLPYAGRRRAMIASALFLSTFIVLWLARWIQMDLPLAVCVLGCVTAVTRVVDHDLAPGPGLALAGLAAGCGFLFKGPVVGLAVAAALLPYLVSAGRFRRLSGAGLVSGAAVFLVVTAPWPLLLVARGETELLGELFYRQNVGRALNPWDHVGPWWYYLREFWTDMAPWSLFVPLAIRTGRERPLDRLAWGWIVATLLVFSLFPSKRSPYILPLAPAVAILVSGVVERWWQGSLSAWRARVLLGIHGVFATLFLGVGGWVLLHGVEAYPQFATVGRLAGWLMLLGGASLLIATGLGKRRRQLLPTGLAVVLLLLYGLSVSTVLPAANQVKSTRAFGRSVLAHAGQAGPLRAYRIWKWRAAYTYYVGRKIERLESAEELRRYWIEDAAVYLIVEQAMLEEFYSIVGAIEPLADSPMGSNHVYLFCNTR